MKILVPLLLAAVVAAIVIVRPVPAPTRAVGWVVATAPAAAAHRPRTDAGGALVYVAGAVAHPGVYSVGDDARVRDVIAKAGGAGRDADAVAVNLAAHVRDGDEIVVPLRGPVESVAPRRSPGRRRARRHRRPPGGETTSSAAGGAVRYSAAARDPGYPADGSDAGYHPPRKHRARSTRHNAVPPSGPIDLNSAGSDLLATVPGIGPGLALRIVAFREVNGPFASPDELLDVAGITDRRLDAILPYVIAR